MSQAFDVALKLMLIRHERVEHRHNTRVWVESQQHPVVPVDVDNLIAIRAIVTKSIKKRITIGSVLKRTEEQRLPMSHQPAQRRY